MFLSKVLACGTVYMVPNNFDIFPHLQPVRCQFFPPGAFARHRIIFRCPSWKRTSLFIREFLVIRILMIFHDVRYIYGTSIEPIKFQIKWKVVFRRPRRRAYLFCQAAFPVEVWSLKVRKKSCRKIGHVGIDLKAAPRCYTAQYLSTALK